MANQPRFLERRIIFNKKFAEYCVLLNKYLEGKIQDYKQECLLFNALKTCYVFYHKTIRDILNNLNIYETLPTRYLKISETVSGGIIDDADIWIEFIEDVNELCQTTNTSKICELTKYIIEKYKFKIFNSYLKINAYNSDYTPNIYINDNINVMNLIECAQMPKYSKDELGITEHSYNLLLNYFKSNHNIKYVWLHGSRAKKCARKNSDIDCIVDIEPEDFEKMNNDIRNLLIPYRVDLVNLRDTKSDVVNFIQKIICDAKIIYRAKDFIS